MSDGETEDLTGRGHGWSQQRSGTWVFCLQMLCLFHTTQPLAAVPFTKDSDIHPCMGSPQQPCGVGRGEGHLPQQLLHCTDTNMGAQGGEWTCPGSQAGHGWANCSQRQSALCLPVGCTSVPDTPRGFLHYHEDPAGAPSQVPLSSPGGHSTGRPSKASQHRERVQGLCHAQK